MPSGETKASLNILSYKMGHGSRGRNSKTSTILKQNIINQYKNIQISELIRCFIFFSFFFTFLRYEVATCGSSGISGPVHNKEIIQYKSGFTCDALATRMLLGFRQIKSTLISLTSRQPVASRSTPPARLSGGLSLLAPEVAPLQRTTVVAAAVAVAGWVDRSSH